jgi:hypothetical protein
VAINTRAILCFIAIVGVTTVASVRAQTPTVELDLTSGYSGEEIRAAAAQVRAFGEVDVRSKIQYFGELAWGQRWANTPPVAGSELIGADPIGSDVFGAAYPYRKNVQVVEAYAERTFRPGTAMLSVRAGQYRTPFGIYDRSSYGYSGFIRPPLIRYDGYYGLSNNYMERGAMITAGVPRLFVEASLGKPHDLGSSQRRDGTDGSVRVQAYHGPFVVGVSHARSEPYLPSYFAFGRQTFTGADARWAHPSGVQLRGEFFHGHSFTGVTTDGWYVDGLVHRVGMGPFTAVTRVESIVYTAAAPFARSEHRVTLGTRVRLPRYVTAQLNYMHQHGDLTRIYDNSVDVTVTYSLRYR